MNMAQQRAELHQSLPRSSSNSHNSGPISSLPAQLVGQHCSVRTDRGGRLTARPPIATTMKRRSAGLTEH